MSIRQRIARFIAGKEQNADSARHKGDALSAQFQVPAIVSSVAMPFGYSDRDAVSMASQSAILTACMIQWMTHYPSAQLIVQDADGNAVYDHPALDPFKKNVNGLSEHEVKVLTIMYGIITGTAYQHIIRNSSGVPIGIDVLHGWMCKPVATKTERIAHYQLNGTKDTLKPSDVIRLTWMMRDPSNPIIGLSPLRSSFLDHASYQQVAQFTLEFLANSATPSSLLTDPNYWEKTPEQRKEIRADLESNFGQGNRGRVAFMPDDMKWQSFSHGLKDMNVEQLRMVPEANICATFMVPPEMIGVSVGLKSSTYDNKAESRRNFLQSTVTSMWMQHASVIGSALAPDGGSFVFDSSPLPAMQEDATAVTERATKLYQAGLITQNEARAMVAFEKTDNGDTFMSATAPVANGSAKGTQPLHTKEDQQPVEDQDVQRLKMWVKANTRLDDHRRDLQTELESAVKQLAEDVKDQVPAKGARFLMLTKADVPALSDESLQRLFVEGTKETRKRIVKAIANQSADDVETALSEISDQLDALLQDGYDISTDKVWDSVETFRNELFSAMNNGDDIESVMSKILIRMATTARTTITATNGQVQNATWKAMNDRDDTRVILKEWLSERDSLVRDSHVQADKQIVDVDGWFTVGSDRMQHPAGGTIAEENINCRCVEIPVIRKKEKQ